MKRIIVFVLSLAFTGSLLIAQDTRINLVAPKNPRVMGMGGSFVAMSEGYASFFGNPADFASKKGELTLSEVSTWLYMPLTQENIDNVGLLAESMQSEDSDPLVALAPLTGVITTNGLGVGMSSGLGWVGKGLAFGVMAGADSYVYGKTLLGATGTLDMQGMAVIGLGIPIKLFGIDFAFGGSLRPYLRTITPVGVTDVMAMMGGSEDGGEPVFNPLTKVGFGLAADLGLRVSISDYLAAGLAIRDITTKQRFVENDFLVVLDALSLGKLPEDKDGVVPPDSEVVPNITAGVSFKPIPVPLRKLLDLNLTAEIQDPITAIQDKKSFMNTLHAGVEAQLLSGLVSVRGGVNRGWLSVGAGIDLLFLETNVAIFTEELGKRPGDRPRSGVSMDFVIRF
ncbi:MAG: hypothetical protein KKI09_05980 [Spirochaetes bacterium]|nr:hypothetical protein [Spirochaetota bacterium]MBU0954964.1 hypothetical protein [Spirochaetota bacterium]